MDYRKELKDKLKAEWIKKLKVMANIEHFPKEDPDKLEAEIKELKEKVTSMEREEIKENIIKNVEDIATKVANGDMRIMKYIPSDGEMHNGFWAVEYGEIKGGM